jgi:sugar lactone lactonase YvrE
MGLSMAALWSAIPASAQAAESYSLQSYGTRCVSGQTDERQYLYVMCWDARQETYLRVVDPAGTITTTLRMPGANDVAPAPDGSYVYVSGGGTTPLRRFDRRADGTYAQNTAWRPPTFRFEGATVPANGRQITTDGYGNLYVANGMWTTELTHMVTKFSPDGRLLAQFGGFSNTWNTGTFFTLSGIAVSRDGRYLYVSEVHNSRVQRFDLQADGSYRYALQWGNSAVTDPYRLGLCVPTMFAAPYDIAVDGWGDVYVNSTSCTYVQKFDKDGLFKFASFTGNRGTTRPGMLADEQQRSHYLAIDARGDIITGETQNWLVRQGPIPAWPPLPGAPQPDPMPDPAPNPDPVPDPQPDPQPGPDVTAPTLRSIAAPATTPTNAITVTLDASDDRAVAQARMATDAGDDWTAWQPYAVQMPFLLRAGTGARGVYVQVRDAAGNESAILYRRSDVVLGAPAPDPQPVPDPDPQPQPDPDPAPGPDVTAPTLRSVTIPATTATSVINVALDGTDDRPGLLVRMATDDGDDWTGWQPYAATMRFTLRAGIGYRGVYVQLRDAAGNEGTILYRTTRVL